MPKLKHGFEFSPRGIRFPDGRRVDLDPKKTSIMKFLFDHEGEYKTWQEVKEECCPHTSANNAVRVHFCKIRKALLKIEDLPFRLDSCYGEGYRVVVL